jgi:hypothetical protein
MFMYKLIFKFFRCFTHRFCSTSIISADYHDYDGCVYNISVDGDETYIADGFVVHNCRSTIVPKVDPRYNLLSEVTGDRPSVGASGAKSVSAKSTYGGWLKKQPASFQDEVLGPTRAKLFRQGGLSIGKFVNFDGETYSLEQLRALNPLAFEKANL